MSNNHVKPIGSKIKVKSVKMFFVMVVYTFPAWHLNLANVFDKSQDEKDLTFTILPLKDNSQSEH